MDLGLITSNITASWMLFGAFLIVIETLVIPGLGLFFAGLGAITTGLFIWLNIISHNDYIIQTGWLFAFTIAWAIVLWKPITKLYNTKQVYNNIIGGRAVVCEENLRKGKLGKVKWSGTIMNAQLSDHTNIEEIHINEEVVITEINGNILVVKPINSSNDKGV